MNRKDPEVGEWLQYASDDLAYGQLGLTHLPRAAAWSFQQAAEKALKAIWLQVLKEIPRTHDVVFLLSKLSEHYDITDHVRDAVLQLAEITPAIRYPSDDQTAITAEEASHYARAAETVYKWAVEMHGKLD